MAATVVRRWASARTARTAAPANAAQAGLTPAAEVATNPARVAATVTRTNTGAPAVWATGAARAPASRSAGEEPGSTRYSAAMAASHGSAISAAKRGKARPLAANASRLVRLDTGSSSDAEFARWVQAYTCGLGRAPSCAEVAYTTGVSSTTVASRLSTAVIAEAEANTWTSSRRVGRLLLRAIHVAAGAEQALVVAELGQHEHRGQEADHRPQPLRLGQGRLRGHRPGGDDQSGRRNRRDRLRPAARPYHRPREHGEQGGGRDGLGGGVQDPVLPDVRVGGAAG